MEIKKLFAEGGLLLCKGLVFMYDFVTFSAYCVVDQPWKHWKLGRIVWSKREFQDDPYSSYVRNPYRIGPPREGVHTVRDLFKSAIARYANKPCYGTREILHEEAVTDQSGKVIKKVNAEMTESQASFLSLELRAVMKFLFLQGKSAKDIHTEMSQTLEEKYPSYSTVKTCISCFKTGYSTVEDEPRSRRPQTSTDTATCNAVHEMILEDRRISAQNIAQILDISPDCFALGEYRWMTFKEADILVDDVSRGLLSIGIESRKPVVLLAETRVEWIITAQACFKINVPVVTLYATLGEAGLIHGINETEVTHVITSSMMLPKLKKILNQIPLISHIVYMESSRPSDTNDGFPDRVNLFSFSELIACGKTDADYNYDPPTPEDLAILMYTSGSTGIPKGVLISHGNLITTVKGIGEILSPTAIKSTANDTSMYTAYLPLAHVFEFIAETHFTSMGFPVGFSSPHTLTDSSPAVKTGYQGDLRVLKPTIIVAVPLMLDRLRNMILTMAGQKGAFSKGLFEFAIKYKIFWMYKGFKTRILDRLILKKCRDSMGGRLQIIVCGGAPISPDTQDFIRACLSVSVIQGYGMTETAASASIADVDDLATGQVGAPLSTIKLRLVDWEEGGYRVTDVPYPRGEIVLGGDSVAKGYYKRDSVTKECFRKENGIHWFYTGDIGEILPNGTYRVIDRKSDLVKLQLGEYVALGKIESQLKTCPLVDNICVVGNGLYNYLVALMVPNLHYLSILAKELGKGEMSVIEMCHDRDIESAVTSKMRAHAKKCGLLTIEIPVKIKLCSEEWVPDNGLVTAAMKLRRKEVQKYYKQVIDDMLASITPNRNVKYT